ncbi:MAG: beta-propeller domain-containing protein [Candidatus Falkowbacteria bacterium]|nr:beta-propeller domain-containing protein [Candidatus Falkowbacteria bacterium]
MFKKSLQLTLLILALALILGGCSWNPFKKKAPLSPNNNAPTQVATSTVTTSVDQSSVKKFSNLDDLKKFLADNNSGNNQAYLRGGAGLEMMTGKAAAPGVMANDTAVSSAPTSATPDYSLTNVQVAGVDEGDIIKSDGTYIYALVYNDLYIIKAEPAADAQVISKLTFKSRPQDLYINGDSLIVYGSDDQIYNTKIYESFRRRNSYVFLKVFDIKDRKSPTLLRDLEFEGAYTDSRLIGDYLYFITTNYSYYDAVEPLMPRVLDKGQVIPEKCDISGNRCYAPDVYYFNIPYDSYNFTSVTAVNIKDNNEAINGQVYLLNGTQNIYASSDNIYITYTKYLDEYGLQQDVKRDLVYPRLSQDDKDKIAKIEASENFILNKNEKKAKVAQIIDQFVNSLHDDEAKVLDDSIQTTLKQKYVELAKQLEQTLIYKIAIKDGKMDYKAMGEVNGQVLNQFSMDENKGYFRIATTKNRSWSDFQSTDQQQSYSNLYILDENLKVVSGLENLATTERIYAARFMGDRAYVVTFRQTDPIYVIDLANPQDPKILAALKIPGFSTYIHPYDANGTKIIGLGRDTEEDANGNVKVKGVKLSLFDFTDLKNPKETSSYVIGNQFSDSVALYDHKAFLFSRTKNLLSIPMALRDNTSGGPGQFTFGGVLVFGINNDKFELKGRIDHSAGGQYNQSDYWNGFNYYDNSVKRSLYINNDLLTFSNKFLMINSLIAASSTEPLPLLKKIELNSSPDTGQIIAPLEGGTLQASPPASSPSSSAGSTASSGAAVAP